MLHFRGEAYVAEYGRSMYDETCVITQDNLNIIATRTRTKECEVWGLLHDNLGVIQARLETLTKTLTYNDYYYTNMVIAKDKSSVFMFDYNLLGKGYAYADVRNVTSSLAPKAKMAFLKEYGGLHRLDEFHALHGKEILIDAVISPLVSLHFACQREVFPGWGRRPLEQVRDGSLVAAVKNLLLLACED